MGSFPEQRLVIESNGRAVDRHMFKFEAGDCKVSWGNCCFEGCFQLEREGKDCVHFTVLTLDSYQFFFFFQILEHISQVHCQRVPM